MSERHLREAAPILVWLVMLLALPLFPSQDGGSHLATARAMLQWLQNEGPARVLLQPAAGLWTNWGATAFLTAGLGLGLSAAWAERLLLVLLGASWVMGFALVKRRLASGEGSAGLESPALAAWLALPFLLSKISLLGFWSFLFSIGLGLLAVGARPDPGTEEVRSARRFAWHLWLLLASVCHPLGGLLALGVLAVEDLAARAPRRLLAVAPHAAFWLLATGGMGAGEMLIPPASMPDWSASILHGVPVGPVGPVVRLAFLGALAVWATMGLRLSLSEGTGRGAGVASALRIGLASATLALFVAACLGPDRLVGGTLLRPRLTLLGWALLVLALPLPLASLSRTSRAGTQPPRTLLSENALRRAGRAAVGGALATAALAWVGAARLAAEQVDVLSALPARAPAPVVLSSYGGVRRHGSLLGLFVPSLHLGSRWAARTGALDLGNYQLHAGHFPLRARRPL
ncbi:MAG: hypothetical protein MI919_42630, partial [Holophagales bacterium]|nr:hypothetical protein [Holophagales bacterium]